MLGERDRGGAGNEIPRVAWDDGLESGAPIGSPASPQADGLNTVNYGAIKRSASVSCVAPPRAPLPRSPLVTSITPAQANCRGRDRNRLPSIAPTDLPADLLGHTVVLLAERGNSQDRLPSHQGRRSTNPGRRHPCRRWWPACRCRSSQPAHRRLQSTVLPVFMECSVKKKAIAEPVSKISGRRSHGDHQ